MNWTTPILEHSGILLAGGSAFLALGLLINLLQRTPILRIRVAEMAVGSALVFGRADIRAPAARLRSRADHSF